MTNVCIPAATCSGSDVLREGNAELSTEVNQHWTFSGPGARVDSVHSRFTIIWTIVVVILVHTVMLLSHLFHR